jgi:hypothetical protein
LRTAEEAAFEVFLTTDKNICYQQNLADRRSVPLRSLLDPSFYRGIELHEIIGLWLAMLFLFGLVPLSLLLSRVRFSRGDRVFYA